MLPRSAVREDRELVLVDDENQLRTVAVKVAWNDEETAAVEVGGELPDSPVVVTTVLGTVIDGTRVRATIDGKAPPPPQRPSSGQQGNGQGGQGRPGAGEGGKPSEDPNAGRGPATEQAQSTDNPRAQFAEWRKIVDAGKDLPEADKQRVRERIASGGRVPPWLKTAVEEMRRVE